MNKKSTFLTALGLVAFAVSAQAQVIVTSVQFVGGGAAPLHGGYYDYTAGQLSVGNWNPELNTGNNGSPVTQTVAGGVLTTSTAGTSAIGYSLASSGVYYTGAGTFPANDPYPGGGNNSGAGDQFLFDGFAFTGNGDPTPLTLSITGLDSTHDYNIYAYISPFTFFGENQLATLGITGGSTYVFNTDGTAGTYEPVTSTNPLLPSTGNYAEFAGVTGVTSRTLTLTQSGGMLGLNGFQVQDLGVAPTPPPAAAPEPSAIWLMLTGLAALGFYLQRRRAVKVQA